MVVSALLLALLFEILLLLLLLLLLATGRTGVDGNCSALWRGCPWLSWTHGV
jgi:hypothetical protein